MTPTEHLRAAWTYVVARAGLARDDKRGLTTTEVAILTFLLAGAAIAVMGIIYNAATSNANSIPDPG